MIVGREEIVGAGSDYDELMEHAGMAGPEYTGYMSGEYTGASPPPVHPGHPGHWTAHPGAVHPQHMTAHPSHPAAHHPGHGHPHAPHPQHVYPPHAYPPAPYPPPPPPQHYQRLKPQAYTRHDAGPRVVSRKPTDLREFPVGFISPAIATGQQESIEVKPQVLFRGERLAVANSIAPFFTINDIKVGKDSQLAASGNLPAEAFSNLSVGVRMELDTAEPGIVITLTVTNNDTVESHDFRAVLYGTVLD
jgi:hypothetical protein